MLGDETRALRYGRDRERDLIGVVERVGADRWRIAFPRPHYESLLDVIELVPAVESSPARNPPSAWIPAFAGMTRTDAEHQNGVPCDAIFAALLLASAMSTAAPAQDRALDQAIAGDMPALMTLYRDLHANPELSMQETRSAGLMAAEARRLGFTVTTGVGGTGVVAVMENGPGPVLMLRADMDALPVEEETGLAFASRVRGRTREGLETGIMHACGHDTHMAAWVGTARRMAALRASWSGTLVMVAQPGEETSQGAKAMLEDGLFTRFPKPTHAIAFHDSATLPAGIIGYSDGPALANVDSASTWSCAASAAMARRRTRPATRSCSPAGSSPRCRPWSAASSIPLDSGRRHRRQLPGRHQAQHHLRRGAAADHRAQLHAAGPPHAARRHRPHRPRRGDRRRRARGPDADRHRPRGRGDAGDGQHRRP